MINIMQSRVLIGAAIVILLGLLGLMWMSKQNPLFNPNDLKTEGQPTIGYPKASVHVVVFEEPKCPQCRNFTNQFFPKIKKDFIDTNQIQYTIIPVSFLPNSMPAAVAWLCVYHQESYMANRSLFFDYVDYMYEHQPAENTDWATKENLEIMAKRANADIELDTLRSCLDSESYRAQIEKNNAYARELMHNKIATPSVYVNGTKVEELSYDNLSNMIRAALTQSNTK